MQPTMNVNRKAEAASQDTSRFDGFGFGARPHGREVAQIRLGGESPHAVDTLIREMPLRDRCRCLNDNLRVGDEVGNAHVDLRQDKSA